MEIVEIEFKVLKLIRVQDFKKSKELEVHPTKIDSITVINKMFITWIGFSTKRKTVKVLRIIIRFSEELILVQNKVLKTKTTLANTCAKYMANISITTKLFYKKTLVKRQIVIIKKNRKRTQLEWSINILESNTVEVEKYKNLVRLETKVHSQELIS